MRTVVMVAWLLVGWALALLGWEILQRCHFCIPDLSVWRIFRWH
jgi:hypothetical protein